MRVGNPDGPAEGCSGGTGYDQLNYSTHPATQGLGLIASRQESVIGLIVHDTMTFNAEGTPLGLIDVQCWAAGSGGFRQEACAAYTAHRAERKQQVPEELCYPGDLFHAPC